MVNVDIYPAKVIYLNFQLLEVVSRYRDPQLQVAENYSYLFNFITNICKSSCLDTHFIPNNSNCRLIKQIKNNSSLDQHDNKYDHLVSHSVLLLYPKTWLATTREILII